MKAEPTIQWRLLDLAALDTRSTQIAHRRGTLPEEQEVQRLTTEHEAAHRRLVQARTDQQDIGREVTKAEGDVRLVRDRAARDRQRLESGQGSPKDLQGLQSELESLGRRQSELEDVELEIMERAEAIDAEVGKNDAEVSRLAASLESVRSDRDKALGTLDDEAADVARRRADVVAGIDAPLVELYEKIRAQTGLGAAALVQRRCDGCRLEIMGVDLERIRSAAADEVLRCEECRRILVRTAESGI